MAVTRALCESVAVARCKLLLQRVGLNYAVADGTNADLNEPLATALERLGLPPADRSAVADGDFTAVPPAGQAELLDLVELSVLEACRNYALAMPTRQAWEDYTEDRAGLSAALETLIADKWDLYRRRYLYRGRPAAGRLNPAHRHDLDTSWYWPGQNPPYPPTTPLT